MVKFRTKRRKTQSRSDEQEIYQQRATHRINYVNAFDKAAKALGPTARGSITAEIQTFVREWKSGVSDSELRDHWDYKSVKGQDAKKYDIKHVDVCRHYRIDFTIIPTCPPAIWFVNVYRRTSRSDQDIDNSVTRAKEIWKKELGV